MKTFRSALWWAGIAWVCATILMLGLGLLAPELGVLAPLSDPFIKNVTVAMLLGSCVALFFVLPPIEPLGLLVLGLFAGVRAVWRRAWGR